MIKILHTGDWHIGTSFSGFAKKETAIKMQFNAIQNMINYAISEDISAILISGDIFDNLDIDFNTRKKLIDILSKFKKKIFITLGNHDYSNDTGFWKNLDLPENYIVFSKNEFISHNLCDNIFIYGASFCNNYETIPLPILSDDNINIGVVHSDIIAKSKYNPYSKDDIKDSNFNYLAFGHNHTYSGILKQDNTYYSSCGSISCVNSEQTGEKGFVEIIINENSFDFNFINSEGLEIYDHKINIANIDSQEEVLDLVKNLSNLKAFARIEFSGLCSSNVFIDKLELSGLFFDVEIIDNTKTLANLLKYLEDDSLIGEFSRILYTRYKQEQDDEILTALELGINALL